MARLWETKNSNEKIRTGKKRKGKERKGKERKGKERKGEERKGKWKIETPYCSFCLVYLLMNGPAIINEVIMYSYELDMMCGFLVMANSSVNPIIYFYQTPTLMKHALICLGGRGRPGRSRGGTMEEEAGIMVINDSKSTNTNQSTLWKGSTNQSTLWTKLTNQSTLWKGSTNQSTLWNGSTFALLQTIWLT